MSSRHSASGGSRCSFTGRTDVAAAVPPGVDVFYGRRGGFAAPARLHGAGAPPLAADVNGDGRTDLAAGNLVFFQSASGRLGRPIRDGCTQAGFGPNALAAADVNGDGRPDLLWAGGYGLVVIPQRGSRPA